jgi:hypothetical protein
LTAAPDGRVRQLPTSGAITPVADKEGKKKNAQLVLRLNKDLRDRFVEACKDLDTSAAREVRRFIKKFLKRYDNGEFDE